VHYDLAMTMDHKTYERHAHARHKSTEVKIIIQL